MKLGIVGYGYVGKAVYDFFKNKHEVIYYDPFVEGSCTKEDINSCNISFVCVFTPEKESGECDTRIVTEVINWINTPLICIKSTVSIGYTDKIMEETGKRVVFSPEYIGESTYDTGYFNFNKSMNNHSFFIFGGSRKDTYKLVNLYSEIAGPTKIYRQTDAMSAEIAKYMENCFFSVKSVFCYEMDQICKSCNLDYNEVRELWLLDPRMGVSHTCVFDSKDNPYDGKCLPKDIASLIYTSKNSGYNPEFLNEVVKSNKRIGERRKEKID